MVFGVDDVTLMQHYGLDPAALAGAPAGPVTVVNLFKLREALRT